MGRRPDKFCNDNVDRKDLGEGQWRCIHCQVVYSGSAYRIRNHLAGQGTDIGHCKEVPQHTREKALEETSKRKGQSSRSSGETNDGISGVKRASKKRGRNSFSREGNDGISAANRPEVDTASANNGLEMATALQVSSFNGDLSTHSNKGSEEEYTTDVLVKFFMSQNLPVDVFKNPHFRNLLTRVAQHGVPSCLRRDDSVGIQKSVSNWEHKVNEYMSMVKESWKTTGCTLIPYNLNEGRGRPSDVGTDSIVYGFYCPKGFIFVEGRQLDFSQGFGNAFKKHVLNLPIKDVTHEIYHSGHPGCEFSQQENTDDDRVKIPCVRQKVEEVWIRICRETGWVDNLIQKSEKLYHYMLHPDKSYKCKGWRKLMVEKDADATPMSSFTRLTSIMQLEDGIKAWPSNDFENRISRVELGVEEIINNNEFWCDGKELLEALTPLMKIIDDVDSLVPTAGYLQVAIDKAKRRLKPYYEREASKYQLIWRSLYLLALDLEDEPQLAMCTYLSPVYDWRATKDQEVKLDGLIDDETELYWLMDIEELEDQEDKLDAERKGYRDNNPFANLLSYESEYTHPVELWNKHGGEFPLLRKCAIKYLSQPGSCMCNQVKKHIKQFKGEDNFILRLNYHMMQEFSKLGDRIYKHFINDEVPERTLNQISPKKMVDGPHIGQIPAWMNEFISKSTDVIADGNCGYRAIAESLGLGQDKWREVRQKLHRKLNYKSPFYEYTHVLDMETVSKALNYNGSGNAPPENWLDITNESTNMGLLVATAFQAIFVVMGPTPTICCTYLPLRIDIGEYPFLYVPEIAIRHMPEIVICYIPERSHFTSLSLTKNAPLPPVYDMWFSHRDTCIEDIAYFIEERLNSYCKLKRAEDRHNGVRNH